jgi:hypothetical protein
LAVRRILLVLLLLTNAAKMLESLSGQEQPAEDERIRVARSLLPDVKFSVPIEVQGKTPENRDRWGDSGKVTRAWIDPAKRDKIYVGNWSSIYRKNPKALAAALAHEQYHLDKGDDEIPAYEYQMQILKSLRGDDPEVAAALNAQREFAKTDEIIRQRRLAKEKR